MNREEIEKIIPHRRPMLLVDEAIVTEDGKAKSKYTVKEDEFFLQGHFPGNPVVPGVILCEMMAQSCCVLLCGKVEAATPYFTGLNGVKFRSVVKPSDTVEFECEITKEKHPFYFAKGKGYVAGKLCIEGEFSFALMQDKKD